MKFALATLALAGSALAAPKMSNRERFARRLERRAAGRSSQPKIASEGLAALATNNSHVEYSTNWAGAVLSKTTVSRISSLLLPIRAERGSGYLDCCHWHVHCAHALGALWLYHGVRKCLGRY